jgi:hypothetical protein
MTIANMEETVKRNFEKTLAAANHIITMLHESKAPAEPQTFAGLVLAAAVLIHRSGMTLTVKEFITIATACWETAKTDKILLDHLETLS